MDKSNGLNEAAGFCCPAEEVGGAVAKGSEEGFSDPKGGGASKDAVGTGPDVIGGRDDAVLESHGLRERGKKRFILCIMYAPINRGGGGGGGDFNR